MTKTSNKTRRANPTRRKVLKQGLIAAGAFATAPTLWLPKSSSAKPFDGEELKIVSWPGWGNAHFTKEFEARTGATVLVKEYIGGEAMLAIIESMPAGSFDLVNSDHEYLDHLRAADEIVALNPSDYPFDDYWPEFQRFGPHWVDGQLWSLLTSFGYIGIAYNSTKLTKEDVQSYDILWDKKVTGKLGWFDWYLPNMGCLSLYSGNRPPYDIDDAAFGKLKDTLFSLAPQTAAFLSMGDLFSSFPAGDIWVSPGIGDWVAQLLQNDGHPIVGTVPKEGGLMWSDSWAIDKHSNNPELARQWLQYLASPEGQVLCATSPAFWRNIPSKEGWKLLNEKSPEAATRLRHRFDEHNILDEFKEGNILPRGLPVRQSIDIWSEVWNEFKSV